MENDLIKEASLQNINSFYESEQEFVFHNKNMKSSFFIGELNHINIFIGNNNAGKSRVLRGLFASIQNESKKVPKFQAYKQHIINKIGNGDYPQVTQLLQNEIPKMSSYGELILWLNQKIVEDDSFFGYLGNLFGETKGQINSIKYPSFYIPILRGGRYLEHIDSDPYLNRTNSDYFKDKSIIIDSDYIFTGQSIYKDLRKHLLGNKKERAMVANLERFLSVSFFGNKSVSLTPFEHGKDKQQDVVYIQIGEEEYPIHNLGDGIQALLVLLFPLFLNADKELMVFIEEPEVHLHPKWQRLFVETIIKEFPHFQFFITTHSNIFLSTQNTSIYRIDKRSNETVIEFIDLEKDKLDIINELGYKPLDLLQANFIVWVEGVSDMIYIQCFLKLVKPDLCLGQHYSIMLYGGSGLKAIEKVFNLRITLKNLNPHFGVILDSDKKYHNQNEIYEKEENHKKLKQDLNADFFWVTDRREIENYIPKEIFQDAILAKSKFPKHTYYVQFKDEDTLNEKFEKYGDMGKYIITDDAKTPKNNLKVNRNIKLPQHLVTVSNFDAIGGSGLSNLLESNDINKYREFIEEINSIMLDSRYTDGYDKVKVAQEVVKLLEEGNLWDKFDVQLKSQIQELANAIDNANP